MTDTKITVSNTPVSGVPVVQTPLFQGVHSGVVNKNDFSYGLLNSAEDMGVCCDVYWCMPCMLGRLYNSVMSGVPNSQNIPIAVGVVSAMVLSSLFYLLTYPWGFPFFLLMTLPIAGLTLVQRRRLRHDMGLEPADASDCLASFFCTPCALCQMVKESSARGIPPGYCMFPSDSSVVIVHSSSSQFVQPAYGTTTGAFPSL